MSHAIRRASELALDETTVTALRAVLKATADEVVQAIIDEVPSYANALSGRMGGTIRRAVRTALGHYLDLASGSATGGDGGDAAYDLGRGEVRDGRSMDALLSAYRVGARVAWRCLAAGAVPAGLPAAEVAKFAELTFAYIDELSAASAASTTPTSWPPGAGPTSATWSIWPVISSPARARKCCWLLANGPGGSLRLR